MSQVMVVPEMIAAAATDVAAMGSSLDAAHLVASAPTVAVLPAAADEVSGAVANLFSQHAQTYQTLAGQAAAFNNQFVQHLNTSLHAYTSAETVNAASLASAAATTSTTDPFGVQTSINSATNEIISLLHQIAVFPYNLATIALGAQFGGLASAILLGQFILFLQYRITVPFAWPFPLGSPVTIPLITS